MKQVEWFLFACCCEITGRVLAIVRRVIATDLIPRAEFTAEAAWTSACADIQ